jgi:low affinity Fe/Cu permease
MSQTQTADAGVPSDTATTDRLSMFERAADWTSAAMGKPTNIIIWFAVVAGWTLMFAFGGSHIASGTWLPAWFTSLGFNFPLNLITTVAELFIGFLVGAASNRSERNLEMTLARISAQDENINEVEVKLSKALEQNTALTTEIHKLTKLIHQTICPTAPAASS